MLSRLDVMEVAQRRGIKLTMHDEIRYEGEEKNVKKELETKFLVEESMRKAFRGLGNQFRVETHVYCMCIVEA